MMAPSYDRARTSPVKITDHESTVRLQGLGFPVVRVETEAGSGKAAVTWRNSPGAHEMRAVEEHLSALYDRVTHST